MRKVLDSLSDFCHRMNVTLLLVHHHGKSASEAGQGGGRGASAIGDWSPNTWELSMNHEKPPVYTFTPKKTRNFKTPDAIKLKLENSRFRPLTASDADGKIAVVIRALRGNSGRFDKKGDLIAAIKNILEADNQAVPSPNTVGNNYIALAVEQELVKETESGNAKSYELNEDAYKKFLSHKK